MAAETMNFSGLVHPKKWMLSWLSTKDQLFIFVSISFENNEASDRK